MKPGSSFDRLIVGADDVGSQVGAPAQFSPIVLPFTVRSDGAELAFISSATTADPARAVKVLAE